MAISRTYEAGRPLPYVTARPGESAASVHQRRLAAARRRGGGGGVDYASLIADYQKREEAARAANIAERKRN